MTAILITGFGPFPGAPQNPTVRLVRELAQLRHPALAGARVIAHVFHTVYAAVDQDLPALLAREKPDALLMFGLAARAGQVRIETRARNALNRLVPDAEGTVPAAAAIAPGAGAALALRTPAQKLLAAIRSTGVPATLSRDAGNYLCNYLCWRATERATEEKLRIAAFIHVPRLRPGNRLRSMLRLGHFMHDDLMRVGEAALLATVAALRAPH